MRAGLGILGLGAVFLLVVLVSQNGTDDTEENDGLSTEAQKPGVSVSGADVLILKEAPFAMEFGKEGLSDEEELKLIQLAFQDYLSFVKAGQRGPIGDNHDFVKALTGGNVQRVAPIPPAHPRISEKKELTDRFGVPFAIHPLSSTAIEIRAAGPDKQLWTDDDQVSLTASGKVLKEQVLGE